MLYALLCGSPPFCAEDKEAIFSLVLAGEVDLSWGPWNHISDDAKDLVLRMLTRDPYKRITPSQIKREFVIPHYVLLFHILWHAMFDVFIESRLHIVFACACVWEREYHLEDKSETYFMPLIRNLV